MAKFVLAYHGGGMPETDEEQAQVVQAWRVWLGSLGNDLIDGGNPVGQSKTIQPDGSVTEDGGANPLSGYSLVEAKDYDDAVAKAKGCPILQSGGTIEVAEAFEL